MYLTGAAAPKLTLVLARDGIEVDGIEAGRLHEILFVPPEDLRDALWHGPGMSLETARSAYGIDVASSADFAALVRTVLQDSADIYVSQWPSLYLENPMFESRTYVENQLKDYLEASYPNSALLSLREELNAMREIKD